jgi:hypothetical protein
MSECRPSADVLPLRASAELEPDASPPLRYTGYTALHLSESDDDSLGSVHLTPGRYASEVALTLSARGSYERASEQASHGWLSTRARTVRSKRAVGGLGRLAWRPPCLVRRSEKSRRRLCTAWFSRLSVCCPWHACNAHCALCS